MESYTKLGTVVRKGAWTREEDERLKQCVQSHGEGKWHMVPYKAELSRCRKSCRLRWLNYLKPNIKRGDFSEDEVDLIIRLHKLLGNRWSMIAGRLPGRTANDVKNYWNTRLRTNSHFRKMKDVSGQQTTKTIVIRPQPRSFVKISSSMEGKEPVLNRIQMSKQSMSTPSETSAESGNNWWETFLDDKVDDAFPCVELEEGMLAGFWFDEMSQSTASTSCQTFIDEGLSKGDHFPFNEEFWNHSNEKIK